MARMILPRDQFLPGLDRGNYVGLTIEEFREGYDMFSAGLAGELPIDPTFPSEYRDAHTIGAEGMTIARRGSFLTGWATL
jgi:hypothetical protein